MKSINVVNEYMQIPEVDFTELFSSAVSYSSTRILIGLTLYHEEGGWFMEICDTEAAFLHSKMEVEMYI